MASVSELLNQIWSIFRGAGIADDLAIISHIAVLLVGMKRSVEEDIQSSYAIVGIDAIQTDRIIMLLTQASSIAGDAGTLLDRYVLFRLSSMLAGGRYPTPRHIVQHMTQLANIIPGNYIADFACGSGGFLVHASNTFEREGITALGIELSPEWAALAQANIDLHNLSGIEILSGNSLRLMSATSTLTQQTFDRILMAQSFGERVDSTMAAQALPSNWPSVSRSETALLGLALHKLRLGGRVAALAPTSLLFNNSMAERRFREIMVEQFHLEAMITLPDDAFQPFSQLQTHLILVTKPSQNINRSTWLFRAQEDGYGAGRSRDLTTAAKEPNDLTYIENAISWWRDLLEGHLRFEADGLSVIAQKSGEESAWYIINTADNLSVSKIELYPIADTEPQFLLVSVLNQAGGTWRLKFPLGKGEPEVVSDLEAMVRNTYKLKKSDDLQIPITLHNGALLHSALVLHSGRLLGICISLDEIRSRNYELRPDNYIVQPTETAVIKPPIELLNDIQENSRALQRRINRLLEYLEPTRRIGQTLLSPVIRKADSGVLVEPFGQLNQEQQAVWRQIQQQVHKPANPSDPPTPRPFQPKDIEGVEDSQLRTTLELIERMGLIVPIRFPIPDPDNPTTFYRLTTEKDLWLYSDDAAEEVA